MTLLRITLLLIPLTVIWAFIYYVADKPLELDPLFTEALQTEAGMPPGPIDRNMVKDLTELDLSGYQLTDVEGIEYFASLEHLNLSQNLLSEIPGLENLDKLQTLNVSFNQLNALNVSSPFLIELDVEANDLSNLSFLQGLDSLQRLTIRDNDIQDVSPLENVPLLTYLNARGNQIFDVKPLSGLTSLQNLNLRNNQVKDVSPLTDLPLGERLYLDGNGIKDFSFLEETIATTVDYDFSTALSPPVISEPSGTLTSGSSVTLDSEADVYYTLNGETPSPSSAKYTGPILINNEILNNTVLANNRVSVFQDPFTFQNEVVQDAVVLRAATYENGTMSETITRTYFLIDRSFGNGTLPVVSLSLDEASLFNEQTGIYVPGDYYNSTQDDQEGNYRMSGSEWEREATMEYFTEDGQFAFVQDIGIRIHGGFSRALPQKSLRLYSKSEYGQSRFYYPFFQDSEQTEFNRLVLRNSGNDWRRSMLRDAMMHRLVKDGAVDMQHAQPVTVYINGEYWGIHNLRETFSTDYIELKYNIDPANIALLESEQSEQSGFKVEEGLPGDANDYVEMVEFAVSEDVDESFDELNSMMDIENFLTYMSYQIYFGNKDALYNNTAIWKKKVTYNSNAPAMHDGRWRWMLYDVDQGFGNNFSNVDEAIQSDTIEYFLREHSSTELFKAIVSSDRGQAIFINKMESMLDKEFHPDNVLQTIDQMTSEISQDMPRHIERWQNLENIDSWDQEVDWLRQYAEKRPEAVRLLIENHFVIQN
ncbi:CotH kinase family protein [Jeotgalibacillus salarius]|nr:CotH kinase family protein [Jeotgalibacillus salarius]